MVTPYNDNQTPKVEQVRKMFNNIAPKYDLLNRIISLGLDRSWRRKARGMLAPYAPKRVLDVATGTGDLAIELLKHVSSVREVLGIDISEEMMRVGAGKVASLGLSQQITFSRQDSTATDLETASFDAATIGFGIRSPRASPPPAPLGRAGDHRAERAYQPLPPPWLQPLHTYGDPYARAIVDRGQECLYLPAQEYRRRAAARADDRDPACGRLP